MLATILIKNFAIIDDLTVDFSSGMTILTGETGAGKSIIIDAVSLLFGHRGSSEFIRHGESKAVLQAVVDVNEQVKKILSEKDIPVDDDQLNIYREIRLSGKNIIRLNGVLTTVSTLKEIAPCLIDIHGQHEHQFLMDGSKHLNLLDQFSHQVIATEKKAYDKAYAHYTTIKTELKNVLVNCQQNTAKETLLKQHIKTIEFVNPIMDEDALLEQEWKALSQTRAEVSALQQLATLLTQEDAGIESLLNDGLYQLDSVKSFSKEYGIFYVDMLDAKEKIAELSKNVLRLVDNKSFDSVRLDYVQERLQQLDQLKKDFGGTLNTVLAYYHSIKEELSQISNQDQYISQKQAEFMAARLDVLEKGSALSQKRKEQAEVLQLAIHQQFVDLYMPKVQFQVTFTFNETGKEKIRSSGLDEVEFFIATNVGEPLKPLYKVASGGELSRIMLALKTIFTKEQQLATVIFDEIDTGVSGRVAQAIAEKMAVIAKTTQVLCVSHLPQVAAVAQNHLFVQKETVNDRTQTVIHSLTREQRRLEIAKMIAGEKVTSSALEHANQLLNREDPEKISD